MAASSDTKSKNRLLSGEWSNQKCIDIAFSNSFPSYVKNINIQKNIISRYLNFYLGAKPQKGLSVVDLAFAVISIMPLHENTEEFLWEDKYYDECGTMFFLTPEDKLKAEVGKISSNEVELEKENCTNEIETDDSINQVLDSDDQYKHTDESENEASDELNESDDDDTKIPPLFAANGMRNQKYTKPTDSDNEHRPTTSTAKGHGENRGRFEYPNNVKWYSRAPKKKEVEQTQPHYGPVENSAFVASCNKLLQEWETNEKARIVLKYFFGIAALILMRATTKKFTHLVNTFKSNKFLSTIAFTVGYLKYSVPHKKCVKNSYRTFSKRDGNTPVMFAKIVVNSFHIDALRKEDKRKLNILKLTILSHTTDYGFGLVSMLQNIEERVGSHAVNTIIEVTSCSRTSESWNRLKNFLETYMVSSSFEATHHWARIISPEFFKDLSCNSNHELSVILGVFIEKITNCSGIWQSAWVKYGDDDNFMELMETGRLMYKEYEKKYKRFEKVYELILETL